MKTLIVGDLHGKVDILKRALDAPCDHVVFVGDYVDGYTHNIKDQFVCLDTVLDVVRDGKATALLGNHEVSYLDDTMRASGFSRKLYNRLKYQGYFRKMHDLLKYHTWVDDFLITHAGVSNALLHNRSVDYRQYLDDMDFKDIGVSRGGTSPVGGLLWCDFRRDFDPVPGLKQVMGHTKGDDIRVVDDNYCIDCLDFTNKALLIDDGNVSTVMV